MKTNTYIDIIFCSIIFLLWLIAMICIWYPDIDKQQYLHCECQCIYPEQKSQIIEQRDLMDDLYFLNAVDGSVTEPTFVPFFCEIYKQCQDKK